MERFHDFYPTDAAALQKGVKPARHHRKQSQEPPCRPGRGHLRGDYDPAGDEDEPGFETTGPLVPPSGIPLQAGAVVGNVKTFVNIAAAAENLPVTHETLTVAGAVRLPLTLTVALDPTLRDCRAAAGGATAIIPELCLGGMMMGETTHDLDSPVTKTTVASPASGSPVPVPNAIGKAAGACRSRRGCRNSPSRSKRIRRHGRT